MIDPEVEVWVWSDSPEVARVLGWGSDFRALRAWLTSRRLWLPRRRRKPQDPKNDDAKGDGSGEEPSRKARRSSSKFHDLATTVDFSGCSDPAFVELTRTLRDAWFPLDEAALMTLRAHIGTAGTNAGHGDETRS